MKKLGLIAVILTGCGSPEVEKPSLEERVFAHLQEVDADEDLRPFLFEVVSRCATLTDGRKDLCLKGALKLTSITFKADMSEVTGVANAVGLCRKTNARAEIFIKADTSAIESLKLRSIMWHELGHCILSYDHVEDRVHLMNPEVHNEEFLGENWIKLENTFFTDTNIPNFSLTNQQCEDVQYY